MVKPLRLALSLWRHWLSSLTFLELDEALVHFQMLLKFVLHHNCSKLCVLVHFPQPSSLGCFFFWHYNKVWEKWSHLMLLRSILHPAECLLSSQLTWEWPVEGAECPNKTTLVLVLPDESQCDLTYVYVHHCALWLQQCRTWLFPLAPSSSFPFVFVFANFGCWLLCCCFLYC